MRPPLASTNWRVRVATPQSRWRKFKAVRSPTSSVRAEPLTVAMRSPAPHALPSGLAASHAGAGADIAAATWRNVSKATSRPATTHDAFARRMPRARWAAVTVASVGP